MVGLAYGEPNAIELVLPYTLIAGDRELERATERLSQAYPELVKREGKNLLIRVGQLFFSADALSPEASTRAQREATARVKEFRLPPKVKGSE